MMDLCVTKFKESEGVYVGPKEAGYCLLRSQLLMAFHDSPSFRHLANEVLHPALLPAKTLGTSCEVVEPAQMSLQQMPISMLP